MSTGIYDVEKTTGEYLSSLILNCLNEHNLPIEKLRGQSHDWASNMSGKYKGVKRLLQKQQSLTYYTHCGAHHGNMIAQAVGTSVNLQP